MNNITYLIGAGASAFTIPVVNLMYDRLVHFTIVLNKYDDIVPFTVRPILNEIIRDLDWLTTEAGSYYSIDTLARKFYLIDELENLHRLKKCLLYYFTMEQYLFIDTPLSEFNKQNEKRYDSFIAAIANKSSNGITINNNIKVLSWNYDVQFELSLKRYTESSLNNVKNRFQIFPNYTVFEKRKIDMQNFSMVKLNGDALIEFSQNLSQSQTVYDTKLILPENEDKLIFFLSKLIEPEYIENTANYLQFAWEKSDTIHTYFKEVLNICERTDILVIIGYSFPVFNREIDTQLFKRMELLSKVYIQDIDPIRINSTMQNAFDIFYRKENIGKPVKFQHETSINQFVIPYELNF